MALVGHTGAGKSTLGKLVARFYEFQGGAAADRRARHPHASTCATYRRQLGVVPQVPFLFSGTVADNIRYARPERDRRRGGGRGAARSAAATGSTRCPTAWHTEVGEGGRGLSMGQRQLVALARVLLQDPAIVILDEATASVDPLTEAQIQEGLDVVLADRTAIVIAHRLSTIQHADRIIVLRPRRASSRRATTTRCWRAAATTPSSTTPISATSRPTTAPARASSPCMRPRRSDGRKSSPSTPLLARRGVEGEDRSEARITPGIYAGKPTNDNTSTRFDVNHLPGGCTCNASA